ncbi:VOC family protein [Alienimonas californiensis]|uniref:Glyoxalase-like domain protein n=1 Tax=Alienimonas californiensis TaxID=2527989 RepID=A0A517P6C3_9PLAN|nr:VOC family protein [Alienimonas californiensis]QDT14921.1 Glyoxalase-like domain protein [Alienimonas californiensis]
MPAAPPSGATGSPPAASASAAAGSDTNRPRVTAFDHATLVAGDLDRTRAFYVGLLGMTEVPRPAFSFGGLWFATAPGGPPALHIIESHGPGTPRPDVPGPGSGPPGINEDGRSKQTRGPHLALRCDDPRAFEPLLDAAGAQFVRRAKRRPDGATQVFVCDPDGHVIELCSAPA